MELVEAPTNDSNVDIDDSCNEDNHNLNNKMKWHLMSLPSWQVFMMIWHLTIILLQNYLTLIIGDCHHAACIEDEQIAAKYNQKNLVCCIGDEPWT